MSANSKPRKHRHKRHYTFMIISGDSDGSTRSLHLNHFKTQLMAYTLFIIGVAIVCYIIYSAMMISSLRRLQAEQKVQIEKLQQENTNLEAANSQLQTETLQLSAAINKRLEDEQLSAEEAEGLAIPSGFPLTGTASMVPAADDLTATEVTEITDENKDEVSGNPIVVFTAADGSSIIASGTGTITSVTTDTKFGNSVTIDHGNGYISIYRNGSDPLVSEGATIDKGDIIFVVTKDNLKLGYQIMQDDKFINPEDLIEIDG